MTVTATAITGRPSTDAPVVADASEIRRLVSSPRRTDRLSAAMHPCIEPDSLVSLAADVSIAVRRAVAGNPATPSSLLIDLAYDAQPDVRLSVAANPATPAQALEALAEDPVAFVRIAAGAR